MNNALAAFPQNAKSMDVCKDWFYNDFKPAYEQSGDVIDDDEARYVIGLFQHLAQCADGNRTTMAQSYFEDPVIDRICANIKALSPDVGQIIDRCNNDNPRAPDGVCGMTPPKP